MKKIKFLIASMLGAIALVFACVLGTRVNAASFSSDHDYTGLISEIWSLKNVDNGSNDTFKNAATGYLGSGNFKVYSITESITNNTGESDLGYYAVSGGNSRSVKFTRPTGETHELKVTVFSLYKTGGSNAKFNYSIDSGEQVIQEMKTAETIYKNTYTLEATQNSIEFVFPSNSCYVASYVDIVATAVEYEEASNDIGVGLSFNITNLSVGSDRDVLTADEVKPFTFYETPNHTGDYIHIKRNDSKNTKINYVEFRNGGLKFTVASNATATFVVRGIKDSEISYFAIFNSTGDSLNTTSSISKDSTYTDYYALGSSDVTMSFDLTSDEYHIVFDDVSNVGRNGRLKSINISYEENQTAKLQRQVSTDKTAIRFIGTLEGFDAYTLSQIDSLKYTIKVEGYKAFDKQISTVYTSIKSGETTICAAKANTYYCSYLFTNLLTENNNKSLVGKNISAYLTVKLLDGTTIKTNSVGYTIVAA